jgi:hypothetical protein
MEYLFIYCLQLFDFLHNSLFVLFTIVLFSFLFFIASKIATILALDKKYCDDETKIFIRLKPFIQKVFVSSFCLWILFALMPTKDTLLLLGGTYYGKKAIKQVATSEKLQKIDTIINLELDKRIKELKNAN